MTPRELPNLVIGNRPAMPPDSSARSPRRSKWLLGCTLGLLVVAGVTASLMGPPPASSKASQPAAARSTPARVSTDTESMADRQVPPMSTDNRGLPADILLD